MYDEYEKIERKVHAQLSYKRPNKDREFFQCSVPEAIAVIREIAQIKYEDVYYKSPDEIKKAQEDREFEWLQKITKKQEEQKRRDEELERQLARQKWEQELKKEKEKEEAKNERKAWGKLLSGFAIIMLVIFLGISMGGFGVFLIIGALFYYIYYVTRL